ncbi:monofunctional biosynthetic peptidoglycan transglycosylase [Bacterioplanoides sp.]|uniref:monofunctional biosynthetic peptidoglycan transglycosylase n=1 Tax=Bacterioplanoides sp. TaxID=2066072 RepID=UPI003B5914D2
MESWRDKLLFWIQLPFQRLWHWSRTLLLITGALVWLGIAAVSVFTALLLKDLPTSEQMSMDNLQQIANQRLHMRAELNKTSAQSRDATIYPWVALDQVSRDLLYSIVLSEDGDFFAHQGIDYDALQAALAENIKRREWAFGASTISQQTAKNLFLDSNKSLTRKFQELIATLRLEQALNKNQILEIYLNIAEFGPDLYGVKAAAQYYFETTPDQLNAAQGAFLALLLPSPRRYHYSLVSNGNWSPALRKKMQRILRDMRFKEFISAEQYQSYRKWRYAGLPEKSNLAIREASEKSSG